MKTWIIIIGLALLLAMLILITTSEAQTVIHQTYPGTSVRDYNKPGYVIESDGTGYQTYPGTSVRNYSAPGFKIEGGNTNAWPIRNQYRIIQPLQQNLLNVWPPQD